MIRKKFAGVVATILIFSILIAAMPTVGAEGVDNNLPDGLIDDLSVTSNNSFGSMLMDEYYSDYEEQQVTGYGIYSVEMDGNTAKVEYNTLQNASLVVGIYDENDKNNMLASGSADVSKAETTVSIEIDTETMPETFYVKAFLVDKISQRPLCKSFSSPMYTSYMKELMDLSVSDFSEERVLNLDSDEKNNFAVYKDNVNVIDYVDGNNTIKTADDENKTYVIENIDESISSLLPGDIFSYKYSDNGLLIVKISEISFDGNTATIIGEDIEMTQVFDYIKINAQSDVSQAQFDPSTCSDGVSYLGEENEARSTDSIIASGASNEDISQSLFFGLDDFKLGKFKINGGVKLGITVNVELYLTFEESYFEFTIDNSVGVDVSVSLDWEKTDATEPSTQATPSENQDGSDDQDKTSNQSETNEQSETSNQDKTPLIASGSGEEGEIPLFQLSFMPVPGICVSLKPLIKMSASIELDVSATLSGTVGFRASLDNGFENLTTNPKLEAEVKVEGSFFIGLSLKPVLEVIGNLAEAGFDATVGVEVSASMDILSINSEEVGKTATSIHDCDWCISGEVVAKFDLNFSTNVLDIDFLKFKIDILSLEFKICDLHYSITHNDFGFCECPFLDYRVTINVSDRDGNPIENAKVGDYGFTDKDGKLAFYLPTGEYDLDISKDGSDYKALNKKLIVIDDAKSIKAVLSTQEQIDADDEAESTGGSVLKIIGNNRLSLGGFNSAYISDNHDLYTWGGNQQGQLGDGTTEDRYTPTKIFSNVKAVSLGYFHSAAITENGDLYTWGNGSGLGTGMFTPIRTTPIKMMSDIEAVSFGYHHSAAITKNGDLYMWGDNYYGQVGDGTTEDRYKPIKILSKVKAVSLGFGHSAAITENGDLYMWGYNSNGQLGDGTTEDRYKPIKIWSKVKAVSLGGHHSAAITENGDLYTWGYNDAGNLGDGTTEARYTPTKIMSNVKAVDLGCNHSAAITENGDLYTWGYNNYGQVGDGTTENRYTPIYIMSNVETVNFGRDHSAAITENGNLYTWGYNGYGNLGDGTALNIRYKPTKISIPNTEENVTIASGTTNVLTASGSATKMFEDLMPNEIYNFYAVKTKGADDITSSDNLLYIDQFVTDESGNLTVDYEMKEEYENAVCFVVPMKQTDLSSAEVTMDNLTYNGEEQFINPTVVLNGETLVEGEDYELCNDYYAQNIGQYTVIIKGRGLYTGEVDFTYYVNERLGDVDQNGKISVADAILVQKHIANIITLADEQFTAADVDQNGKVTVADAIMIQKHIANIITIA